MQVKYQAAVYDPNRQYARYVRAVGDKFTITGYSFCEVGDDPKSERRYDIRQGTVASHEIPDAVRSAADARFGIYPSYVDWPYL